MAAKRGRKSHDFKIIEISGSDKSFDELCMENKWLFELTLAYARKLKSDKHNNGDEEKKTDS
ncbi:hypothetical protein DNHGIG_23790 [Collibacillus ludicampi]|uniref:Uncharacterized protein n=1 Tax=Collibacillus ludicampi TaxID=2771369 RepID=A0AAV4LGB4_9BACL|nr:hypothetical protein [Collibacillus ludicampi]GIM46830.1 hypothetical protein DNHGIG_23790 [Collibacillus ludicampi]